MTTLWASVRPSIVLAAELLGSGGPEWKWSRWPSPWKRLTPTVCLTQPCLANSGTDHWGRPDCQNMTQQGDGTGGIFHYATLRNSPWQPLEFKRIQQMVTRCSNNRETADQKMLCSPLLLRLKRKTCWKWSVDSHVWRDLVEVDSAVSLHVVLGVDLQLFVGVDWNQHRTDVRLTERRTPIHLDITFCNWTRKANYWLIYWYGIDLFWEPQYHN